MWQHEEINRSKGLTPLMSLKSITFKMMLLIVGVLLLLTAVIDFYAGKTVREKLILAAQHKLSSDMAFTQAFLDMNYPGEWAAEGDKLVKGGATMNDQFEWIDRIGTITGNTVTLFLGDMRVTTNVLDTEGKRAVGTKVSEAVSRKVLSEDASYLGEANVIGTINQALYEPIKNGNGETIGIFYVGVPNKQFDLLVEEFNRSVLWLSFGVLFVCIIATYALTRPTVKSLQRLTVVTEQVSNKDLSQTVRVRSKDEIGRLAHAFERMRSGLSDIIGHLGQASVTVKNNSDSLLEAANQTEQASLEVAKAIQRVAEGTTEQSTHVHAINDMMHQTVMQMEQGKRQVETTLQSAVQSASIAEKGDQAIEASMTQFAQVIESVRMSADRIDRLNDRSDQIGEISSVIADIANQTHLLALNAAIEAARAGEHGLGFAVVAAEVRKLAEQSGQAAERIAGLIRDIQSETTETAAAMEGSMNAVHEQIQLVEQGRHALRDIVQQTGATKHTALSLSGLLEAWLRSANEVLSSIASIQKLAQDNASLSEEVVASAEEQNATVNEIASAAKNLTAIAAGLNEQVKAFKL